MRMKAKARRGEDQGDIEDEVEDEDDEEGCGGMWRDVEDEETRKMKGG